MIRSHFGVIAIAAMVGVAGCGEDKKAQAPATLTIAIGSVAPLTGGIAHLGKGSRACHCTDGGDSVVRLVLHSGREFERYWRRLGHLLA